MSPWGRVGKGKKRGSLVRLKKEKNLYIMFISNLMALNLQLPSVDMVDVVLV
jgi:hypothetical protein